jgi:hypothetical protein
VSAAAAKLLGFSCVIRGTPVAQPLRNKEAFMLRKILCVLPILFLAACGEGMVQSSSDPQEQSQDLSYGCTLQCQTQYENCVDDTRDDFELCLCTNVRINCRRGCGIPGVLYKCPPNDPNPGF